MDFKEFYKGCMFVEGVPTIPIDVEYLDHTVYDEMLRTRDEDRSLHFGRDIYSRKHLLKYTGK